MLSVERINSRSLDISEEVIYAGPDRPFDSTLLNSDLNPDS